ncbi:hypothetical protein FDP41_008483 [Naegleria fowleri]|uniref:Negative elongation factor D n=1 Tax=Naegleria fowleri TaxID=5763 RepID=A0A6A5BF97_NAEFO|nr:uncharacterized protein FDP41_008483 [Naegleria fowleri]KAF0973276.1 hypothetical protein FDP41_008483 [Naegleria fowleri]CAG4711373.1 unnamed protein product [Naegleria fowleri]
MIPQTTTAATHNVANPNMSTLSTGAASSSSSMDGSVVVDPTKQILEECERKFSENDAITNPFIFDYLKQYIKNGGKPSTIVQMLSSSYKGYPQMTSLLCDWMTMANIDHDTINKILMDYLKNLIIDNFDSKKADAIFTASQDPPKWLEYMINDIEWRNLIYQLSEKHPNCLMLNFAIQRISESGFHNEIASVTTATTSLKVFHRILTDSIENLIRETEESLYASPQFSDFKKICCHSQYTYIYAQCIIKSLISQVPTYKDQLLLLSEELEHHALKEGKASEYIIRKIRYLFLEYEYRYKREQTDYAQSAAISDISTIVLSMLNNNATNPTDVLKLYKYYSNSNPPPVEFIQSSDVLDLLVQDLFNPSKKVNPAHRPKYIYVLAYASSVVGENNHTNLNPLSAALEKAISICSNTTLPKSVSIFRPCLIYNVVCAGILYWVGVIFTDSQFSITMFTLNNTRMYMALLKEIAFRHEPLSVTVLNIVKKCYYANHGDLDPLQAIEIKKVFLDVIIYLMQLGYVLPTLQTIHDLIVERMDMSLVRHVINSILDMIEPPFSLDFIKKFVEILCIDHARDAISTKSSPNLVNFLAHVVDEGNELYQIPIDTLAIFRNIYSSQLATLQNVDDMKRKKLSIGDMEEQ